MFIINKFLQQNQIIIFLPKYTLRFKGLYKKKEKDFLKNCLIVVKLNVHISEKTMKCLQVTMEPAITLML